MRTVLVLATICLGFARADAARTRGPDPLFPPDAQVVVTGEIVAMEPRGEWEIGAMDARPGHWLWSYSVAKIRIAEILKNRADVQPEQGDTLEVWFITSAEARNSEEPGMVIWSEAIGEDIDERHLQVGQTAAYFVHHQFEHWYFAAPPMDADTTKHMLELMKKDSNDSSAAAVEGAER